MDSAEEYKIKAVKLTKEKSCRKAAEEIGITNIFVGFSKEDSRFLSEIKFTYRHSRIFTF